MIKLHEDGYIQGEGALADHLQAAITYRGAAITLEDVQERIDSGHKLDVYKYEIVDGQVRCKTGDPFFIKDPEWQSPILRDDYAIHWRDQIITPETDPASLPEPVATFVREVYSFNNGEYAEKWRAAQVGVETGPEPLTPEQQKEVQRREIIATYQQQMDALTAGYTQQEIRTFDQKAEEARAVLMGRDMPTPMIDTRAARTGEQRIDVAREWDAKAQAFAVKAMEYELEMDEALAALG